MDSVDISLTSFLPQQDKKNKCYEKLSYAKQDEQEPFWLSDYVPFQQRPVTFWRKPTMCSQMALPATTGKDTSHFSD